MSGRDLELGPVREMLQLDGGDIELLEFDGAVAQLRLIVVGSECAECVLPRVLLEEVALKLLRPLNPGLSAVRIDDPRES